MRVSGGWGSSPHTRGTLRSREALGRKSWDHPRIRGEHVRRGADDVKNVGIILAYAGNTRFGAESGQTVWGSSPHTRGTQRRSP